MEPEGNPIPEVEVYRGGEVQGRPLAVLALALLISALLFLVVPITELFARREPPAAVQPMRLTSPPPTPPPPPPPPPEEQEPPELAQLAVPPPPMKPVSPPLTLSQLDVQFSPDVGDFIRGDFKLDFSMSGPVVAEFKVFELSEVDQPPTAVFQAKPVYPRSMIRSGVSATVTVQFIIDAAGEPSQAKVIESSHPAFNEPALQAVIKSKFKPSIKNGQAVPVWVRIPYRFQAPSR